MGNTILGQKLKHLRQLSNLTQQDAADKMGLKSKSTISMWESGKTEPDVMTFLSLCCEYGLPEARALVEALELEGSAALDFSVIATEAHVSVFEEDSNNKKRYAYCPYCGEKLD